MKKIFLDSGAHSLYEQDVKKMKKGYAYFETDEFWEYVDNYCDFIRKYRSSLAVYVNVDVIFRPDLSWKVYRYMVDTQKLKPLPVVHFDVHARKYLKKYMDECEYIGLATLGSEVNVTQYMPYGDELFTMLCDDKGRVQWKTHGFATTALRLLLRYPWYSVDSSTFRLEAAFGGIFVPNWRDGKWSYLEQPKRVCLSALSGSSTIYNKYGGHYNRMTDVDKALVNKYIDHLGYTIGASKYIKVKKGYIVRDNDENERWFKKDKVNGGGTIERVTEHGLSTDDLLRAEFNIKYFSELEKALNELERLGKRLEVAQTLGL